MSYISVHPNDQGLSLAPQRNFFFYLTTVSSGSIKSAECEIACRAGNFVTPVNEFLQLDGNPRQNLVPIVMLALPEQLRDRVPRTVVSIDELAPISGLGKIIQFVGKCQNFRLRLQYQLVSA